MRSWRVWRRRRSRRLRRRRPKWRRIGILNNLNVMKRAKEMAGRGMREQPPSSRVNREKLSYDKLGVYGWG